MYCFYLCCVQGVTVKQSVLSMAFLCLNKGIFKKTCTDTKGEKDCRRLEPVYNIMQSNLGADSKNDTLSPKFNMLAGFMAEHVAA